MARFWRWPLGQAPSRAKVSSQLVNSRNSLTNNFAAAKYLDTPFLGTVAATTSNARGTANGTVAAPSGITGTVAATTSNATGSATASTSFGVVVDEASSTGATFSTIFVGGISYRVATFATSGTLVVTKPGSAEHLLVAGGGGGGWNLGGGGGGGGLLSSSSNLAIGSLAVTVGTGGISSSVPGTDGTTKVGS